MVIIPLNRKRDKVLNDFARDYRDRTLTYLHKAFSLSPEDCEDVFQESSIVLYRAAGEGKLDRLTSSLYTYFIGICNNKAHEQLRSNGRMPLTSLDDFSSEDGERRYNTILNKADKILKTMETTEKEESERNGIIQDMVRQLPSPCNEILWSYYRDGFSMKTIAQMFKYASEGVAKVTKHRCQEKFRISYEGRFNKL
jgi:RNA polymerase sigma factor (sigma-70 family)